jgi:protein-disulfide isomerase
MQTKKVEEFEPDQTPQERRRNRVVWIGCVAAVLLVVAGAISWGVYRSKQAPAEALPAGVTSDGGQVAGIMAGDEGGPVRVEVYLDFMCPGCRQISTSTTLLFNQLLGQKKIKLIWHPVSFMDTASVPAGYSTRAASAVACAATVSMNKMKALGEALLTIQPPPGSPGFNDDQLVEIGGTVGLNAPSFAQCVRAQRYRAWVTSGNQQALRRGIQQAPGIYVAGKPMGQVTPNAILAAVTAA